MSCSLYFRPNLTKLLFSVLIVMKVSNTKHRKISLSVGRVNNAENAGRCADIMKLINACAPMRS